MHSEEMLQTACSHTPRARPRPGRRRSARCRQPFHFSCTLTLMLLVLLSCSCSFIHAASVGTRTSRSQQARGRFVSKDIIFDDRPAPQPAIHRRAEASSIAAPVQSSTNNGDPASSDTSSGSSPSAILSAPTNSVATLPKPFDGGLGTNYTQPSCPTFLKSMISNDTFTSCLPFSLLLQVS